MQIKNHFIKKLLKLLIIITIFESIYLTLVPYSLEKLMNNLSVKNYIQSKINANIVYTNPKIKTHIIPAITLNLDNLKIQNKLTSDLYLESQNTNIKLSLLPLIFKKIKLNHINSDNITVYLIKDIDGHYNIENLLTKKDKKNPFKFSYKNSSLDIKNYKVNIIDKQVNQSFDIIGNPLKIFENKKKINIKTKGNIEDNKNLGSYDIDLVIKYPINFKNFKNSKFDGSCLIYNLNLNSFLPYIQNYIDKNISEFEGIVEFLQLSATKGENNHNNIVISTKYKDVIFNKSNWANYIVAKGEHNVDTTIELFNKNIQVNSFKYKADGIDIKADGLINIESKPDLDINVEIKNSRAEKIAALLPPTLAKQYKTVEKVKRYGVFGDVDAKGKVKGKIPQPDITGYVKGRNVHILDKSLHKLHKGTVDIEFNKRILNMDILVELMDNQKATVKGYTYIYRDGINNAIIKTTDNLDFPLAQKIIIPISKVFNFQLGPIPEMNITSGKGKIDLDVKGSIDYINVNGYAVFDNAQLTYNGLHGEVTDGKGRLDFNGDVINFKSEKAFVKGNPLSINGTVKINDNLNYNIETTQAQAKDLMDVINNSELLKDVKAGLAVITSADGIVDLFVNITAKIVPVPYGHPPLPPEEAFKDMKVKGDVKFYDGTCYLEGFYTPIHNVNGNVDFTETVVNLNNIKGISGTSPVDISGKIITDVTTKIPDVDITVVSDEVNFGDTVEFLTKSYMYPEHYPDLSDLYKLNSRHDLYFKYKAKSIDFVTDKAFAVLNIIPDDENEALKAKSGKITLENSNVKIENIKADIFDSNLHIDGVVNRVDTLNPIYNVAITSDNFNLENLNNLDKINILPSNIKNLVNQFKDYKGFAKINLKLDKNIFNGQIELLKPQFIHSTSNVPFLFDDFIVNLDNNTLTSKYITANIGGMPFYSDIKIKDIYKNPNIDGYFTTKLKEEFIKNYLSENISNHLSLTGDINLSAKIDGYLNDLDISPKITFHKESDIIYNGTALGEIYDVREFKGDLKLKEKVINIKNLDYIKYITSQNNKTYPINFANINGILRINKDNLIIPEEINIKTNKNLSARVLNFFIGSPLLKMGTINCDLKYKTDFKNETAKLLGNLEFRNIDIPLFDTVIKHVKIESDKDNINMNLFGFITDGRINVISDLENNLYKLPKIKSLNIFAEQIDNNKLMEEFYKTRQALTVKSKKENIDLSNLYIENGYLEIKKFTVKSLEANNLKSHFEINKEGIFTADNINVEVGQGIINGKFTYDLNNTNMEGNFELNNVDSNYIAHTLFDAEDQIYGNANGKLILKTKGFTNEEIIKNLSGFVYFDVSDGRMPKLGSLEYLLHASNIIKGGITSFTLNNILEILNLVKTGYFSNINGSCIIENGIAKDIEIYSTGENLSLYINGKYDINQTHADMEILGKLSKKISTIFGALGNTSLNTFFKLIPGISMLDFGRKDFIENIEKIPSFTNGNYESRTFQAIINGNINDKTGYVQSFKWVKE